VIILNSVVEKESSLFHIAQSKKPFSHYLFDKIPCRYQSIKFDVGENPRQLEKSQIVQLANTIAKTFFIGAYDFDIGANKVEDKLRRGEDVSDNHLRAVRIAREEVLYNILR